MKNLILAAAIAIIPSTATANVIVCVSYARFAEQVMIQRQHETPRSVLLDMVSRQERRTGISISDAREIINTAYNYPVIESEFIRQAVIEEYASIVYDVCMRDFTE